MKERNEKLYVGIDVHSRQHQVAIISSGLLERPGNTWRRVKALTIKNNTEDFERLHAAIEARVPRADNVIIAVDHTGGHYSEPIVYFLQAKGYRVYHLETKAVKAARERLLDEESKSDTIDSNSIAYLLYLRDIHGLSFRISATTPELGSKASALNSLILQRWQYHRLANQATNRLHQLLLAVFPEGEAKYFKQLMRIAPHYPTPTDIIASDKLQTITKLRGKDRETILSLATNTVGIPGDAYRWLIKDLSTCRAEVLAKRDMLTTMIRSQVRAHPYASVLLSFPFLGEIAAATIIGTIKDVERWPDKKKFKKALGVYCNLEQSGAGPGRGKHGREGSRHGRRVLFQVCIGCVRRNVRENDFRDYYFRQVARGKPRLKALFSTMGKLAEIIYHCLKAGEQYQYEGKYRAVRQLDANRMSVEREN